MSLTVHIERIGDHLLARIVGDVDLETAGMLTDALVSAAGHGTVQEGSTPTARPPFRRRVRTCRQRDDHRRSAERAHCSRLSQ